MSWFIQVLKKCLGKKKKKVPGHLVSHALAIIIIIIIAYHFQPGLRASSLLF